nr:vinorine synthase-like [Ipomoea batatas]
MNYVLFNLSYIYQLILGCTIIDICNFREAIRKKSQQASTKKTFRATHNVNLRARMNPPLTGATFGNLWSLANTTKTASETCPNDDLVFQLRTSIREINAEYAEALQNEKWHSEHLLKWHERFGGEGEAEFLEFTSWCRETSRKNPQHAAVKKTFPAAHAVNLRARMNPPLPDATFGNLWSLTTTVTPSDEAAQDDLVFQLRTSIRKINAEYVEALQNGKGHSERLRKWHEIMFCNGETEFCKFSSWCRFPIYEVDFGWGRPVWACTATVPYKNVVRMMSTKCGDGIEAWINMGEDDIYGN